MRRNDWTEWSSIVDVAKSLLYSNADNLIYFVWFTFLLLFVAWSFWSRISSGEPCCGLSLCRLVDECFGDMFLVVEPLRWKRLRVELMIGVEQEVPKNGSSRMGSNKPQNPLASCALSLESFSFSRVFEWSEGLFIIQAHLQTNLSHLTSSHFPHFHLSLLDIFISDIFISHIFFNLFFLRRGWVGKTPREWILCGNRGRSVRNLYATVPCVLARPRWRCRCGDESRACANALSPGERDNLWVMVASCMRTLQKHRMTHMRAHTHIKEHKGDKYVSANVSWNETLR